VAAPGSAVLRAASLARRTSDCSPRAAV
jgi:hypothetical protein